MPTQIRNKNRRPAHVFLKEWLEYRHLSAEQLAGRLETSKSVISKLINGRQRYNQDWLEAIAFALDCEVPQLYRHPKVPTHDELLASANAMLTKMGPETRATAMNVLLNLSELKTGT